MTDLARQLEVTTAAITKISDRLAAAGLLRRQLDKRDRRVVRAVLTPAGIRGAHAARVVFADALRRRVVASIKATGLDRIARLLGPFARDPVAPRTRAPATRA